MFTSTSLQRAAGSGFLAAVDTPGASIAELLWVFYPYALLTVGSRVSVPVRRTLPTRRTHLRVLARSSVTS
ncbi:hypothetical protein [Rhodococcus tibetensis]|uniref:Uncharacterized protein n=1 Tax=Rhodococcus tibetensis TaxID=2965064 RepID=A0ABT1QJA1_9NOCA|nr:hypothetical protein [Rhodococcus sp. FXJ9.536]MCQ4122356.1 hypothetical protein [Rhodococcus sp. FXJ9.536]